MSVELDDLYSEFRVEEQDLRIIKALVTDKMAGKEFRSSYDHTLFLGDSQDFGEMVLRHLSVYDSLPSKRALLETNEDKSELIDYVYNELDKIDHNNEDFKYDLEKIKNRFTRRKIHSLKEHLDEVDYVSDTFDDEFRKIKLELEKLQQVRAGKKKIFKQYTLKEFLSTFKADYVRKSKDEKLGQGILTGYGFLDYVKNGMQPSELLIIAGSTGSGKAQPLETLIPTPKGFKQLKDIHPGDQVFGKDGNICNVVAESKIFNDPGWKFIFNDGSEVISHDNHEWLTFSDRERYLLSRNNNEYKFITGTIRTSKEISKSIMVGNRRNYSVPVSGAIKLPNKDLLIDPYILGLWLGDGHTLDGRITTADIECLDAFIKAGFKHSKTYNNGSKAATYSFLGLKQKLRQLALIGDKHIPHDYLWASEEQRLALLQGLMDSDGYISKKGQIDFVNTNQKIAEGLAHLIRSLGAKCTITEGEAKLEGRVTGPKWTVRFSPEFDAFRLKRKLERQNKPRLSKFRYIVKAVRVSATPMKCIQVDSTDHLYLCTQNFIPTHNSMLLNNMAIQMWMQKNNIFHQDKKPGHNILYFSLEMPYEMCFRRTMARLADVPIYGLRDCQLDRERIANLNAAADFISSFNNEFEIVDVPRGVDINEIEERFNQACARGHRPEVVVVDYLGLMEDDNNSVDDWLKLGNIAGKLHEFARVYEVPVLTAVQLNRAQKGRSKKEGDDIGMHRIGRSSLIMHHANLGIQIESREDEHTYADMIYHIIKNRDGELGKQTLLKNFANATVIENPDSPFIKPSFDDVGAFSPVNMVDDISGYLKEIGWAR